MTNSPELPPVARPEDFLRKMPDDGTPKFKVGDRVMINPNGGSLYSGETVTIQRVFIHPRHGGWWYDAPNESDGNPNNWPESWLISTTPPLTWHAGRTDFDARCHLEFAEGGQVEYHVLDRGYGGELRIISTEEGNCVFFTHREASIEDVRALANTINQSVAEFEAALTKEQA